jgi:hypothetical protein
MEPKKRWDGYVSFSYLSAITWDSMSCTPGTSTRARLVSSNPSNTSKDSRTHRSSNVIRWLLAHGYSDEQIAKVVGGNALRALRDVWV